MAEHYPVAKLEEQQTEEQFKNRLRGQNGLTVDNFIAAIREELPDLKFRSCVTYNSEVAVYREGDAFARGWINYGDYSPADKIHNRFIVYSHTIENGKYRSGSTQRNMAMTTDIDKAVKLVKKHLRPIPARVVAKESIGELNRAFTDSHQGVAQRLINSRDSITGRNLGTRFLPNALENALALLRMQGITIGDKDFHNTVEAYFEAKDAFIGATQLKGNVYFVHPHMRAGIPTYDAIQITWDKNAINSLPYFKVSEGVQPWNDETNGDMDAIKGRVAVLNMMQNTEFVHDVGMKVDANRYFVVV
jgi:hypothetical protein